MGEWLDTFVDDGLNLALIAALACAVRDPARSSLPHPLLRSPRAALTQS
jgi:hypothetical protein